MTPTTSSARVLLDVTLPRTLDQWLAALVARPAAPGTTVEGWLYEGVEARRAAEQRLASAGIESRLHSAYKPLVHHFLESVELHGLRRVAVRYPVHPMAPARRFALEAYPLADMLAGIDFELAPMPPAEAPPHYQVDLEWADGRRRQDVVFAPNRVHVDALGETLLSPTAWLRVRQGSITESDGPHESEHEALFRLAIDAVMAHDWPASEPYFERLDLRADLPGIAFAPPEESSWINSHEALHEDLYFTLMEIFQRRSGRAAGDRRLQPGQIVPDVRPSDGTVRLRIATRPYPAAGEQPQKISAPDSPIALAAATEPLAPAFVAEAFDRIANRNGRPGVRFVATSRDGRPVHGVHHRGSGPAVLISGGQHANETSGVVGALRAAQVLAERPDAHFAVIPLENPDGYALHQELWHACAPPHASRRALHGAGRRRRIPRRPAVLRTRSAPAGAQVVGRRPARQPARLPCARMDAPDERLHPAGLRVLDHTQGLLPDRAPPRRLGRPRTTAHRACLPRIGKLASPDGVQSKTARQLQCACRRSAIRSHPRHGLHDQRSRSSGHRSPDVDHRVSRRNDLRRPLCLCARRPGRRSIGRSRRHAPSFAEP